MALYISDRDGNIIDIRPIATTTDIAEHLEIGIPSATATGGSNCVRDCANNAGDPLSVADWDDLDAAEVARRTSASLHIAFNCNLQCAIKTQDDLVGINLS